MIIDPRVRDLIVVSKWCKWRMGLPSKHLHPHVVIAISLCAMKLSCILTSQGENTGLLLL